MQRRKLEIDLASRWEGVRLPRASGKPPDFPGSSPNFPGSFSATSPEVLSLWNLTVTRGSPEVSQTSPEVPRTSPEVPRTSPEVSPFLWEVWHPLLTHKLSEKKVRVSFLLQGLLSKLSSPEVLGTVTLGNGPPPRGCGNSAKSKKGRQKGDGKTLQEIFCGDFSVP